MRLSTGDGGWRRLGSGDVGAMRRNCGWNCGSSVQGDVKRKGATGNGQWEWCLLEGVRLVVIVFGGIYRFICVDSSERYRSGSIAQRSYLSSSVLLLALLRFCRVLS
ncbi:hypothetical protein MRB53_039951 [Persea americana]|nr:hypothetical protein MRB53_039951 [Persea americana]